MPEYGRTLRLEDLGFTADVLCIAGVWTRLGTQLTVPAGVKMALGRRYDGYVAIIPDNTSSAVIYGRFRVVVSDPQEYRKVVVCEFHSRTIGSITDKRQKKIQPLTMPWVRQDSKIWVEANLDATDTVDFGDTLSALDFTEKTVP